MSPQQISNAGMPLNNVDGKYVNVTGSTYSGNFGSTSALNNQYGMHGISSNVAAANASKGGSRRNKISRHIKRFNKSRKTLFRNMKRKMTKMFSLHKHNKSNKHKMRNNHHSRKQRGGYHQFNSNVPNTPSFSTGGHISPSMSALANPVPFKQISNCTNCVDNYNHNTNKGYQFW